jgi:hypothetical protein
MNEKRWLTLAQADVASMASFVRGKGSERKHRLLACACCEICLKSFQAYEPLAAAFEVAVRTAEGACVNPERDQAFARATVDFDSRDFSTTYGAPVLACGNREQVELVPSIVLDDLAFDIYVNPRKGIGPLLHCVFGNPFRPVPFDPRWRTSDVIGLAMAIYEDKAFERMPILADALMDAGCEYEQVIGHCRGEGPHVRGCWVVDMLLGKD